MAMVKTVVISQYLLMFHLLCLTFGIVSAVEVFTTKDKDNASQENDATVTFVSPTIAIGDTTSGRQLKTQAGTETIWKQKTRNRKKQTTFAKEDSILRLNRTSRRQVPTKADKRLRLGVFLDEAAYRKLSPFYNGDEKRIVQLLVGVLNQIQAVFFQEQLRFRIALNVVHLEILKKQPATLSFDNHEAFHVLTTFCEYQKRRNNGSEDNPKHWDMALYFTGLDLYSENKEKRSYSSMGLSVIDGICKPSHSCVVGEFGVTSVTSRPYLSSGFMAAFVIAHEIGHSMGMLHDGYGNDCPKDGFLMSASRGISGETVWSKCSAAALRDSKAPCLKNYDEDEYKMFELDTLPGQIWNADDQCKVFLKDDGARHNVSRSTDICSSISCLSSDKINSHAAGPALDGTFCGSKKWCRNGKCTAWKYGYLKPLAVTKGDWSDWTTTACISGCLEKSEGIVRRSRKCNNPKPSNAKFCSGKDLQIELCNDSKVCSERESMVDYATEKCEQISELLTDLTSKGNQMPYNEKRKWQSCAIYCRTKDGTWYTPRFDLHGNLTADAHFPDGSWCHRDTINGVDYFCMERECTPGNQRLGPRKNIKH